ncbi:Mu transposase domain-containing protein [Kitasatospora paranensis]|uniref:IS21 family transposase n=1 Tax=Kitasatospora paranensis TaxID=258053 RepID=A0ABW2FRY9_9ACTN
MLTEKEYRDVCALRGQGWSVSAIARHLGRDRKTVRSYLAGDRTVGVRRTEQDGFLRYSRYCRQRLLDEPHLRATVLFDELVELGYRGGYSTFTRALRKYRVRPACERCLASLRPGDGPVSAPSVEDVRFDWLSFPDPPAGWGCRSQAHVLMASVPRTGRWRAVLAESSEFPQLVEATDRVLRHLGGTGGRWLFDPVAAACCPGTGRATAAFARVARYYGAAVDCRTTRGAGARPAAGGPEAIARFWWRTVGGHTRLQAAQDGLDQLARWTDTVPAQPGDAGPTGRPVAASGLSALPAAPFPALIRAPRTVTRHNLVAFRGNLYAVPFDLVGALVEVRWRLDETHLSISTMRGAVIARHFLAPRGAGLVVCGRGLDITLERPGRSVPAGAWPCRERDGAVSRPPSAAALAEAAALRVRIPAQGQGRALPPRAARPDIPPPAGTAALPPVPGGPNVAVEVRRAITAITEAARSGDDGRIRALLADLASADTALPAPRGRADLPLVE